MENIKKETEQLLAKYEKEWAKYGMGASTSYSSIVTDLRKLVKLFAIPVVSGSLPHIHKAGKADIDQCEICGLDIRNKIHMRL